MHINFSKDIKLDSFTKQGAYLFIYLFLVKDNMKNNWLVVVISLSLYYEAFIWF